MKKAVGLLSLMCVLILAGSASQARAGENGMFASGVNGPVSVIRGTKTVDVKEGDQLRGGDRVKTTGDSRLDVIKAGSWGYRLLQSSECVIHTEKSKTEIEILQGNIIFNGVQSRGGNLTVRTPVAAAEVRGAQFWSQVTPAGDSHNSIFGVRKGAVEVTVLETDQKKILKAGQALEIFGERGTAETREAKATELEAIGQIEDLDLA